MTSWVEIANGDIDTDSPGTQPLFTALRDNVRAAMEGADGGPVNLWNWAPVDKIDIGDNNDGLIWDHSVDGTTAIITSPEMEDGYEYAFYLDGLSGTLTANILMALQRSTDDAWLSNGQIGPVSGVAPFSTGMIVLQAPRLLSSHKSAIGMLSSANVNSTSASSQQNMVSYYSADQFKVKAARLDLASGSFSAGKLYWLRRRWEDFS